jgi:hypothetical protein
VSEEEVIRGSVRFTEADIRAGLADMRPFARIYHGFALALAGSLAAGAGGDLIFWVPLLAAGAIYGLAFVVERHHARAMIEIQHLDEGEVSYRFDAQGFTLCAPGRSASVSYRVLHRFHPGRTSFLLYLAPRLASVVPRRAFPDADQARILALLSDEVKPHRVFGLSHALLFGTMAAVASAVTGVLVVRLLAG